MNMYLDLFIITSSAFSLFYSITGAPCCNYAIWWRLLRTSITIWRASRLTEVSVIHEKTPRSAVSLLFAMWTRGCSLNGAFICCTSSCSLHTTSRKLLCKNHNTYLYKLQQTGLKWNKYQSETLIFWCSQPLHQTFAEVSSSNEWNLLPPNTSCDHIHFLAPSQISLWLMLYKQSTFLLIIMISWLCLPLFVCRSLSTASRTTSHLRTHSPDRQ